MRLMQRIAEVKKALISGDWFTVGTEVESWDRSTGQLTLSQGGILDSASGESIARIGFCDSVKRPGQSQPSCPNVFSECGVE